MTGFKDATYALPPDEEMCPQEGHSTRSMVSESKMTKGGVRLAVGVEATTGAGVLEKRRAAFAGRARVAHAWVLSTEISDKFKYNDKLNLKRSSNPGI